MKVVCVLGSPRIGGNTDIVADAFLETAKKAGAETKKFYLNKMQYRGCQACMGCKKTAETCVLKDDLSPLLDEVRQCDVLVLCSPVYYGDITSQMKAFIDRTYCYLTPDFMSSPHPSRLKSGKQLVFIQAQGHPDLKQFQDIFPRYEFFLKWYGFEKTYLIRAVGVVEKGMVKSHPEVLQLAEKVAKEVTSPKL